MKENKLHIHWYPGHIAKAERKLKEQLSLVDAVIEVIDARLPLSSSYTNITGLLGDKPRLILLNKSDLTERTEIKSWVRVLEEKYKSPVLLCDAKNSKDLNIIIKKSNRTIRTAYSGNYEKRAFETSCKGHGCRNAKCRQIKYYQQIN